MNVEKLEPMDIAGENEYKMVPLLWEFSGFSKS